jgi:hypothetical protein
MLLPSLVMKYSLATATALQWTSHLSLIIINPPVIIEMLVLN